MTKKRIFENRLNNFVVVFPIIYGSGGHIRHVTFVFFKVKVIDWWQSHGPTKFAGCFIEGNSQFCRFCEKLRETVKIQVKSWQKKRIFENRLNNFRVIFPMIYGSWDHMTHACGDIPENNSLPQGTPPKKSRFRGGLFPQIFFEVLEIRGWFKMLKWLKVSFWSIPKILVNIWSTPVD